MEWSLPGFSVSLYLQGRYCKYNSLPIKKENNHRYVSLNNHFLLFLQYERTYAQLCVCKVLT